MPDPRFYLWSFPGCPVRVRLDLELVERISDLLGRGAGRSGLLLGRTVGNLTEITDFQALPGSAVEEVAKAATSVAKRADGLLLVGYYRTHSEDLLRLNGNDYVLAEACFTEPYCVFLLIRPSQLEPATATFFFRDERGMNGDFPFLEFPFDPQALVAAQSAPGSMSVPLPLQIPREDAGHKPWSRRRRRVLFRRVAWTAAAVALAGGAGWIGAHFNSLRLLSSPKAAPPAALSAPASLAGFGLRAERQEDDLKLTWNREAAAISTASSGVLSIQDGSTNRKVELDGAQVRGGSILYSPTGEQVQMELSVSGPAGPASESVIVIMPKSGAPLRVQPVKQERSQPREAPGEASRLQPQSSAISQASAVLAKPRQFVPPQKSRSQAAPPLAIDSPPAVPGRVNVAAVPASLLSSQQPLRVPAPPAPAPPAPSPSAPSQAAPQSAPAARADTYRPPVLVRQSWPLAQVVNPLVLKPMTVSVRVSINEAGKVVRAEALDRQGIPSLLVRATESAARLCEFRPAREGNAAVASDAVLRYQLKPSR